MRVLCFHGVGHNTPKGFASAAMKRLGKRVPELKHASVHWGPLLDAPQEAIMREMRKRGSSGNLTQRIVFQTLGDALAYRNVEGAVRAMADYELANLGGLDVVVGHSLGAVLAHGWLTANPQLPPVKFLTIGCNMALWHAGSTKSLEKPRNVKHWCNVFDPEDALGGPLGGFTPYVRDVPYDVGPWYSWLIRGASHVGYWNDKDLWSRVVPTLLGR